MQKFVDFQVRGCELFEKKLFEKKLDKVCNPSIFKEASRFLSETFKN
jgi:hypothetical protein